MTLRFPSLNSPYLSFVADVSNCNAGQLEKKQTKKHNGSHKQEVKSLRNRKLPGVGTDHARAGSCNAGFGIIVLVNQQLSTGVSNNQLVKLQGAEEDGIIHLAKIRQTITATDNL